MRPDELDDEISEIGWAAVAEGLHRLGRAPTPEEIREANIKHGRCICGSLFDPECPVHGRISPDAQRP